MKYLLRCGGETTLDALLAQSHRLAASTSTCPAILSGMGRKPRPRRVPSAAQQHHDHRDAAQCSLACSDQGEISNNQFRGVPPFSARDGRFLV